MSTDTSNASKASKTSRTSKGRPGPRMGEHVVAVRFAAWGPQEVIVRAYSQGGRGGAPYLVVGVGACTTYAYDRAAVDSHVAAWAEADQVNRSVRLPEFAPTSAHRRHVGEDLAVICNLTAEQRHTVTGSTGPDGRPVITVTVGAIAVDVHTTTALWSYLAAWRKAATVTNMLRTPATSSSPPDTTRRGRAPGARPQACAHHPQPARPSTARAPTPPAERRRGHARPMTPTPPPFPTTPAGYVVLDPYLPDRPPLGEGEDYQAALLALAAVQEEFYDQLDANGEGGGRVRLALTLAPVDATGTVGPPCYWESINGMRPAQR